MLLCAEYFLNRCNCLYTHILDILFMNTLYAGAIGYNVCVHAA